MLNAKNQFIIDMKPEAEAYLYNLAAAAPAFSASCADALMSGYAEAAEKAVKEMTMIACQKYPEAFCQYVVMRSCELFLLDKNSNIIAGGKLNADGQAAMAIYEAVLKAIAADPKKPAGIHNETRLAFVKNELSKRMK